MANQAVKLKKKYTRNLKHHSLSEFNTFAQVHESLEIFYC